MAKLTVINRSVKISKSDFMEILKTWNDIYACLCGRWLSENKGLSGMRKVAASMYVIEELSDSPAAYRINEASRLAASGAPLDRVHLLLKEAEQILTV